MANFDGPVSPLWVNFGSGDSVQDLLPPWSVSRHRRLAGVSTDCGRDLVFTKSRGRYCPILKTPHDEYHPDISKRSALAQYHDWLPMMQMDNSRSRYFLEQWNDFRHGRHYYITRVSCVPNEKKLPPIDGFQRSSNSSLPEFATWDDMWNNRKLFSNRSHPLAEGQILESTGMSFHSDKHKCTFHQNILLKVISSHLVLSRLSQLWSSATVSFKHKCRVEN